MTDFSRLPPKLTASAVKRKAQDKSRAVPATKRPRAADSSTFTHQMPDIINYSHTTWGPSNGDGIDSNETQMESQMYVGGSMPTQRSDLLTDTEKEDLPTEVDVENENSNAEVLGNEPGETVKQTRSQAAIDLLDDFTDHIDDILRTIIAGGAHQLVGSPCCKQSALRLYRCRECFDDTPVCLECISKAHACLPFHPTEIWMGTHFEKERRDRRLFLMHGGKPCPHQDSSKEGNRVEIVHTNGIHFFRVFSCKCPKAPSKLLQYVHCKILPVTPKSPRVCFTFELMKDFHVHSLISKKSGYDYIRAIQRKTSALVSDVPDPYPQFMRIARLWRLLTVEKRSGRAFGIDAFVKFRPSDSVALPCLPCPYPDFNMAPNWEKEVELAYRHDKELNMDGNFHLCKMAKNCNPKDRSIWRFSSCLNRRELIDGHLKQHGAELSEKSTCVKFNAVENQNRMKHRGEEVTGIFSILCKHGVPEPLGTVDLQRGERFINVDFVLALVLRNLVGLRRIIVAYDIACQYEVNVGDRFAKTASDVKSMLLLVLFLVGKLHLQVHEELCQYLYSFNYTDGVGRMDGEGTERFWSEMNQAAGSTKQMNTGNREEVLNDMMINQSWTKNEAAPILLAKQLRRARNDLTITNEYFIELTAGCRERNPAKLKDWEDIKDTKATRTKQGVESVFKLRESEMPSREETRKKLVESANKWSFEMADGAPNGKIKDAIAFLNLGIDLQVLQRSFILLTKQHSGDEEDDVIERKQAQLNSKIDAFRLQQYKWMPAIRKLLEQDSNAEDDHSDTSKTFCLYLPSDFSAAEREELGITALASVELSLREGQAYDILNELRQQLKVNAILQIEKEETVLGTRAGNRSMKAINEAHRLKRHWMSEYRAVRAAMISLGLDGKGPFKELTDADLYRRPTAIPHALNTGTKPDGWIWTIGVGAGASSKDESDLDEDDKVHWFRARASRDRCQEEVHIVEEDLRRYVRACVKLYQGWDLVAQAKTKAELYGAAAYASRTAAMFRTLASRARKTFQSQGGKWSSIEDFEVSRSLTLPAPVS